MHGLAMYRVNTHLLWPYVLVGGSIVSSAAMRGLSVGYNGRIGVPCTWLIVIEINRGNVCGWHVSGMRLGVA